ncbi:hypothetical protein [Pseudomonas amygdali]|uniref:Uncharacterized protein n=1 Tax=Pseudomonas amygdali pv. lachrymans str. M301315 TaxID=629260 RepID=A0AAD0VAC9_PSEAV|nr:hypothetical protein [Pseudomonas amygdali]AXH60263.1 hypothetical protein PLA107_034315 [Pseudomonas amygdali pv. lachrymans str. M301315]RMT05956.1 hypothetical protein ALP54_04085 [Pseudomonas amygdali pv. lachrymans]
MTITISDSIRQVRDEYVQQGLVKSYYEINNGLCEDLAMEAMARVTIDKEALFDAQLENFMDDENQFFDFELLRDHWDFELPKGVTQDMLNNDIRFGNHVFVADYKAKRFYDSECPDGVASFLDLPLFRRYIVLHLRSIGTPADEVVTQDVMQAPLCSIPNPPEESPGLSL